MREKKSEFKFLLFARLRAVFTNKENLFSHAKYLILTVYITSSVCGRFQNVKFYQFLLRRQPPLDDQTRLA